METRVDRWPACSHSIALPLDPEIFNNVYNAIAREARVMGRLTISPKRSLVQTDAFSFRLTFRWELFCFLSPRKTSEILNPDVSVVKSAFSFLFFFPSLRSSSDFFPFFFFFFSIFGDITAPKEKKREVRPVKSPKLEERYSSRYTRDDISTESCLVHRAAN